MSESRETNEGKSLVKPDAGKRKSFGGHPVFWAGLLVLTLCFASALYHLVTYAMGEGRELYSYILLIPFVSGFLVWCNRRSLPTCSAPRRGLAAIFIACGGVLLIDYWLMNRSGGKLVTDDRLAFTTGSFLLFFYGICCFFLGRRTLTHIGFPLGLLVFIVPFPVSFMGAVEVFLQHGSALAAEGLFSVSNTTYSREGLFFHLPGITIQVASECSGVHSSLVLLITSLVAGYFFLRSPTRRTVLAIAVIPLGLLRNGLRIFTIGQLCIHVGPEMIDSSFHHQWGGTVFFVLSLVPFLGLLYVLQKAERANSGRGTATVSGAQEEAGGHAV